MHVLSLSNYLQRGSSVDLPRLNLKVDSSKPCFRETALSEDRSMLFVLS